VADRLDAGTNCFRRPLRRLCLCSRRTSCRGGSLRAKSGPQTVRLVSREKRVLDPFQLLRLYCLRLAATRRVESDELVSMRCRVVDALAINLPVRWSETACYSAPPLISILCDAGFHSNSPVRRASVASCEMRVSRLVDRDLTGKLTDVIFSFYFLLLGVQRKEEQTNGNISAHLADEQPNPVQRDRRSQHSQLFSCFFFFLALLTSFLLFILLVVDPVPQPSTLPVKPNSSPLNPRYPPSC
jgi:hypothetical protein